MQDTIIYNPEQLLADSTIAAGESANSDWILHHILDGNYIEIPFAKIYLPEIHLFGIDLSITRHVVFMLLAAVIMLIIFLSAAKKYRKSAVPSGLTNLFEIFIIFIRDEIVKPTIGKGYEKFLPYLITVFFFILFCNFLGLVPYGSTATGNISVTASLALLTFGMIQVGGMAKNGVFGYIKGLVPHGIPGFLIPLLFVVELLGLFIKPFALAIRLFANMTAGHIVILALIGLIFFMKTFLVVPLSILLAIFIYLLEILVAFIQAYIFTMLSSLFIGMGVHQDH